jgi:hypothetical protein
VTVHSWLTIPCQYRSGAAAVVGQKAWGILSLSEYLVLWETDDIYFKTCDQVKHKKEILGGQNKILPVLIYFARFFKHFLKKSYLRERWCPKRK